MQHLSVAEQWALVAPISSTLLQELLCAVRVAREKKEDGDVEDRPKK